MAKQGAGSTDDGADDDSGESLTEGIGQFFDKSVSGRTKDADDDDDEDDDEEEGGGSKGADDDDDEEEGGPAGGDDDDEDDDEEDEDDDEDDEDDEDDDEDEDDDDEDDDDLADDLDPDVAAAAQANQIPTKFTDVLKKISDKKVRAEVRGLFASRLKEVEKGLTRAFQQARKERPTLAKLQAERDWIDKNPLDFILEQAEKDPKLFDKLNEELEKMETKAYAEAKKMRRDDAKKELDTKAKQLEEQSQREEQDRTRRQERAEHVTTLAKKLATAEGVPFRLVQQALYIAITTSAEKDVTDAQVRSIVKQEAKELRRHTGERKREDRKTYIRTKSADSKSAKRRVTGRDRGHAPAPSRVREPKSLEEALTRRVAKMEFDGS